MVSLSLLHTETGDCRLRHRSETDVTRKVWSVGAWRQR
jgi:hypothetical protein